VQKSVNKKYKHQELVEELHYQLEHNICPRCGTRLKPNYKFCHQCGSKLGDRTLTPGMELYKRCTEK
jgi:ribosomal protein L40E